MQQGHQTFQAPGDSALLESARRYAATPRVPDQRLARVGAQFDGSFVGLATVAVGVLGVLVVAGMALAAWRHALSWTACGIAGAICVGALLPALIFDRFHLASARAKCEASVRDGQLVIAHVVQANSEMYSPGDGAWPVYFVFSLSPNRAWDLAYGRWLAARIASLKRAPDPGGEVSAVWAAINDDHSSATLHLPPSFAGDGAAHMYVRLVSQELMPGQCIGPERAFVAIECKARDLFMAF